MATSPARGDNDSLSELLTMLSGRFETLRPTDDSPFSVLLDRREVVNAPRIGDHVMYWQVNRGEDAQLYRQRLLAFARDAETGDIVQASWSLNDAARYVDAFGVPDAFAEVSQEDVTSPVAAKCLQRWRRSGRGWIGTVDPAACRIWSTRRDSWRRIESEIDLSAAGMWLAERGYEDDMTLAFGTPIGERLWLARIR